MTKRMVSISGRIHGAPSSEHPVPIRDANGNIIGYGTIGPDGRIHGEAEATAMPEMDKGKYAGFSVEGVGRTYGDGSTQTGSRQTSRVGRRD